MGSTYAVPTSTADPRATAPTSTSGASDLRTSGYDQGRARVSVATSVQGTRTTYPAAGPNGNGGTLTYQLIGLLERGDSAGASVGTAGAGQRAPGSTPTSAEEAAGVRSGGGATTGARRALVVANGDYADTGTMGHSASELRDLEGVAGDGAAMAASLGKGGFEVTQRADVTAPELAEAAEGGLSGLAAGSEYLVYFSGHGTPEGLIGRDGSVYTPAQATALSNAAQSRGVHFDLVIDACHAGVFADAIRADELREADAGLAAPEQAGLRDVVRGALALQSAKDAFIQRLWAEWWNPRFQLEKQLEAAPDDMALMDAYEALYARAASLWDAFVGEARPLLDAALVAASAAAVAVPRVELVATPAGAAGQEVDTHMQAGLDDLDSLGQAVLDAAHTR